MYLTKTALFDSSKFIFGPSWNYNSCPMLRSFNSKCSSNARWCTSDPNNLSFQITFENNDYLQKWEDRYNTINQKMALNTSPISCRIYPKTLSWDLHLISVWARIWWDIWSIGLSQMPQLNPSHQNNFWHIWEANSLSIWCLYLITWPQFRWMLGYLYCVENICKGDI